MTTDPDSAAHCAFILEVAAERVGLHPNATKTIEAAGLIDWEGDGIDRLDIGQVERALGRVRADHRYLFVAGAPDVRAGARDYSREVDLPGRHEVAGVTDLIARGLDESTRERERLGLPYTYE
jgi:hypothetical protein